MANSKSANTADSIQSLLLGSDETTALFCQTCELDNKKEPAYGYCKDCAEHLCKECYRTHRKPSALRGHILLDSSKMPQTKGPGRSIIETCAVHDCESIVYLCTTHDMLGCNECVDINHRSCKTVKINEVTKDFQTSREYKNKLQRIEEIKNKCLNTNKTMKENIKITQQSRENIRNEVKAYRKQINDQLDRWEKDLLEENDSFHDTENVKSTTALIDSRDVLHKTQQLEENIKRHKTEGNNIRLYIQVKKDITTIQELESITTIQELESINGRARLVRRYAFQKNTNIFYKSCSRLGQISARKINTSDQQSSSSLHLGKSRKEIRKASKSRSRSRESLLSTRLSRTRKKHESISPKFCRSTSRSPSISRKRTLSASRSRSGSWSRSPSISRKMTSSASRSRSRSWSPSMLRK